MRRFVFVFLALIPLVPAARADIASSAGPLRIELIADRLNEPWGLAFLPGGGFLVTERGGRLSHFDPQRHSVPVTGVPRVVARGQGGLLDVMVPRDFATSREVFLSFSDRVGLNRAATALGVGRLSADGGRLEDFRVIFRMSTAATTTRHFGARIVEARDGTIFLSIGERGQRDAAQDPGRDNGKVIRLNRDGSVPADNPFVGIAGARPEIWSLGHRNPQGLTLDADGRMWAVEHGAMGGDEVNRIGKGANYGWPVIAFGLNYDGTKIGEGTEKTGMQQPAHYWDPSIAPSGMIVYSGKLWPEWRGDVFVGSLKFHYLSRLDPDRAGTGGWAEERLESDETIRVRDVREAPDGSIWFLSVGNGAVYRITPG